MNVEKVANTDNQKENQLEWSPNSEPTTINI
jgi:hypothetical protein